MRSTTTFLVFGGILLLLIIGTGVNKMFSHPDPVYATAQSFVKALHTSDAPTIQRLIDSAYGEAVMAGPNVSVIQFKAQAPFEGADSSLKPESWGYIELATLDIKDGALPVVAENMATLEMADGQVMYLRRNDKDMQWKITYISRPKKIKNTPRL